MEISGAPGIAGLRFCTLGPEPDWPAMADVYNRVGAIDNPPRMPEPAEAVAREFGGLEGEQRRNVLLAEVDGRLVGWGDCWVDRPRAEVCVGGHSFHLLHEWRRRGIGQAALRYLEQRTAELRRDCPARQAIYKIFLHEAEADSIALLRSAGYEQMAAHAIMLRPHLEQIPDAALPEGMEVRPVGGEHLREIYNAHREAFQEHIHGFDPSNEDYRSWSSLDFLADRSLWIVAWDCARDEIAGSVLNYVLADENAYFGRKRGYVEYVSVRRPYRRRGLARAMVSASLRLLRESGYAEAGLSSHTENPFNPISMYAQMGFRTQYHVLVLSKSV